MLSALRKHHTFVSFMSLNLDRIKEKLDEFAKLPRPTHCEMCGNLYDECNCKEQEEAFWQLQKQMDLDESI